MDEGAGVDNLLTPDSRDLTGDQDTFIHVAIMVGNIRRAACIKSKSPVTRNAARTILELPGSSALAGQMDVAGKRAILNDRFTVGRIKDQVRQAQIITPRCDRLNVP